MQKFLYHLNREAQVQRRYREDRDTAAVVSGSRDREASFQEHWELALDGPDDAPWRVVGVNSR